MTEPLKPEEVGVVLSAAIVYLVKSFASHRLARKRDTAVNRKLNALIMRVQGLSDAVEELKTR